ncbi:hypothetical protein RAD16_04965 [Bradyrhizobium sp. 18BD]
MQLARFAKFAIVAAVLVTGSQANSASTIYGNYYDETASVNCAPGSFYCRLNFSQLPSTNLTKVKKVHCFVSTQATPIVARLHVSATSNGNSLGRYLPLQLPPPSAALANGYIYTSILVETDWLVGQSRFPFIEVYTLTASPISIECTLIGESVDPIS